VIATACPDLPPSYAYGFDLPLSLSVDIHHLYAFIHRFRGLLKSAFRCLGFRVRHQIFRIICRGPVDSSTLSSQAYSTILVSIISSERYILRFSTYFWGGCTLIVPMSTEILPGRLPDEEDLIHQIYFLLCLWGVAPQMQPLWDRSLLLWKDFLTYMQTLHAAPAET
jgi:hypothetical protein